VSQKNRLLLKPEFQASNFTGTVQNAAWTRVLIFPTKQSHRPPLWEFSPCLNRPLPQLVRFPDWY